MTGRRGVPQATDRILMFLRVAGVVAFIAAAGCAPPVIDGAPPVHESPPPAPSLAPVTASTDQIRIARLAPPLPGRDSTLAGYRFVVDPGHGGGERGAPSPIPGNAPEADLNLAVSLFLAGLLEASGAEVSLTRTADMAPTSPGDLAADLAVRSAAANTRMPDLFLSIHHNGSHDSRANRVELYPKLRTDGASRDAAEAINRELGRLYPDFESRVVAGNFAVLRRLDGEGILVECSYLSDRRLAPALESVTLLKAQAEAIYRGIAAWASSAPDAVLLVGDTAGLRVRARSRGRWVGATAVAWSRDGRSDSTWTGDRSFVDWILPVVDPDSAVIEFQAVDGTRRTARWLAPRLRPPPPAPALVVVVQGDSARATPVIELTRESLSAQDSCVILAWDAVDPSRTLLAVEDLAPRRLVVVTVTPDTAATSDSSAASPGSDSARIEVVHYFRSASGKHWATDFADRITRSGIAPLPRVIAGSHYLLNHTSMPALWVRLTPVQPRSPRP